MTTPDPAPGATLASENADLRARLEEAEDTLRALADGEVDAIIVGADIFTLEGAEAAANRFRSDVLAQMEEAVVALDADGRVVYMNTAAERQYATTASQALGRPRDQLYGLEWLSEADREESENALQTAGYWRGGNIHRTRHGHGVRVESTLSRLRDTQGGQSGTLIVARDVTEQAKAEAALRESRARLQFALASARVGEWELDLDTGTNRRSLRHDQCFGYREPVPHWSYETLLAHVTPEDRALVDGEFHQGLASAGEIHFECRVLWPDGSRHWIEMHAAMLGEASAPRRLVGIVSDISERKHAEAALRSADERKNVFLATLAHELRNPLAPIRNSVQIIRLTDDERLQQRALATVERQLEHMVHLVDDLMDVSRITLGKMELRRGRVDIGEVLANAVDSAQPLIDKRGHRLEVRPPPQPLRVNGDMTRLTQVVANLLDNSAKYTPDGGSIVLAAAADGPMACITVQDTGVGIDAAAMPHVFDLFTQAKTPLGRMQSGMGIGLALVRQLVEMHGGNVSVDSPGVGQGCTIELRLPLADVNEPPRQFAGAEGAVARSPDLPHRRVMVAEDNPDSAESMSMLLRLMGHEVRVASDGRQAVETAASFRPHVVLMDIGLPGFDGYEATRRIRAQPWGREMLMVALTGWGQEDDRQRSRDAGLDRHLVKPVDPVLLAELFASGP